LKKFKTFMSDGTIMCIPFKAAMKYVHDSSIAIEKQIIV